MRSGPVSVKLAERLHGAVAQLVARLHGMEEARGSNPLSSTIEDVLEHLTSVDSGSGVRAANGSASRIVALRLR